MTSGAPPVVSQDWIVAISTAGGTAAIGVVRLSGDGAVAGLQRLLHKPLPPPRRPVPCFPRHPATGKVLDHAVVWWAPAPGTYTGEEMVEIHAHGNPIVLDAIVDACCLLGARVAEAGEFTRRALINGKLDLAGAEAVLASVEANSVAGAGMAARVLSGELAERVDGVRSALISVVAEVEAAVDFEEEIGPGDEAKVVGQLESLAQQLVAMAGRVGEVGRLMCGAEVAILGPPNVGKSTLFNRFVGEDRAIVHETAGTTRDVVSGDRELGGMRVRFHDTAGLRAAGEPIEDEGIRRAEALRGRVDLVIYVKDATRPELGSPLDGDFVVINKADLAAVGEEGLEVSAVTGEGIEALIAAVQGRLVGAEGNDVLLWTTRQREAGQRAADRLGRARQQLTMREYGPATAELWEALRALEEILGVEPQEAVLDELFSRFCIGK